VRKRLAPLDRVAAAQRTPRRQSKRPTWDDLHLWQYDHPTRFSDSPTTTGLFALARALKKEGTFLARLTELLDPPRQPWEVRHGPERAPGNWALIYLLYVRSQCVSMRNFWGQDIYWPLWKEAGFDERPNDDEIVRLRFIELEQKWEHFRTTADELVSRARRFEPRIGQIVHVDATGWHTEAVLVHCCRNKKRCRRLQRQQGVRMTKRTVRATNDEIKADRHGDNANLDVDGGARPKSGTRFLGANEKHAYYEVKGHLFRTRDVGARLRAYTGSRRRMKGWLGGYSMIAVDEMTRAPVSIEVFDAREMEYDRYPLLMEGARRALGDLPIAMTGDRGLDVEKVYRWNTEHAVASAIGSKDIYRTELTAEEQWDAEVDDQDTIRCEHCGGPTDRDGPGLGLRFVGRDEKPYIDSRCILQLTEECKKKQSDPAEKNWRRLGALSIMHPRYHDLREAHDSLEAVFGYWRKRYSAGGDDQKGRLKRYKDSVSAQRLRGEAARLIEWFYINLRQGWLADSTALTPDPPFVRDGVGAERHRIVKRSQRKRRLDLPFGPAAVKAGLRLPRPSGSAATSKRQSGPERKANSGSPPTPRPPAPPPLSDADEPIPF
jgi:hypothetical protein